MFTFIIIVIMIVCVVKACKKDKHNVQEDNVAIVNLPSFSVRAKPMSTMSKFLNLAIDKGHLLQSFSYSGGFVTITLENGKTLYSSLDDMSVQFEKANGIIDYTIKSRGQKVNFYYTTNITNQEWDAINGVLCLARTTWGRDIFSKEAKYVGYVNIALKAIKALS